MVMTHAGMPHRVAHDGRIARDLMMHDNVVAAAAPALSESART